MTYRLPELSASETEETPADPRELITRFLQFTEASIAQTQRLIDKGIAAQSNHRNMRAEQSQPLQTLADCSNISLAK